MTNIFTLLMVTLPQRMGDAHCVVARLLSFTA
jgi:hypothetical protein